jgi:hypothetical protein
VLVVIGPRWLTITDEQSRPLIHLPEDVHRQEIALALSRADVTVIPVLVDEAALPRPEQLPPDIRGLPDQQARKIGDTQARRTADVAVLVRDIQLVSGLKSHVAIECKTAPWWRLDITTLVITCGLTLTLSVWAYLANMPLDGSELLFVLVVSWVLVVAIRGVWTRFTRAAAGWTS